MKAIVEVISGTGNGQRFVLRPRQRVRFGRTVQAEASFPQDDKMSSLHFQVSTDEKACYLQDLGSTNGTKVNGEQIESVVLKDGDVILSGQTQFRVSVDGDRSDEVAPLAPVEIEKPKKSPAKVTIQQGAVQFQAEKCGSGLTLCLGDATQISPAELIERLTPHCPAFLLSNVWNLEPPEGAKLDKPAYIYDWLDEATAQQASPVLFSVSETPDWDQWLEAGWGQDAQIVIFSKSKADALLDHLRGISRGASPGVGEGQGALGLSWPSVTTQMLQSSDASFLKAALGPIETVLLEDSEQEDTWRLFGSDDLPLQLAGIGLVEKKAEEEVHSGVTQALPPEK